MYFDQNDISYGSMYIFIPNMKSLCLVMWLGGLNIANANDDDNNGQSMTV